MTMEEKKQRVQEYFDHQNFMSFIGAELKTVDEGRVSIACRHWNELTQHQGSFHAGILASIADMACGCAALSVQDDERVSIVSSEFSVHLLRPAIADEIEATGVIVKAGKRLCITEAEVRVSDTQELVAKLTGTMVPVVSKE